MTQGKKYKPSKTDFDFVEQALNKQATTKSICSSLGISNNTYQLHFASLETNIKKSISQNKLKLVQDSLFRRSQGYDVPIETTKHREVFDNTGKIVTLTETTTTTKHIQASDTAIIFYLCNRDPENWHSINNAVNMYSDNDHETIDKALKLMGYPEPALETN